MGTYRPLSGRWRIGSQLGGARVELCDGCEQVVRFALVLSPRATQVVVTSGHDVANNEPDLVAEEILQVLEAARAG